MSSNYGVMIRREGAAPDEKSVPVEPFSDVETQLLAALHKYLDQGAVLVKDAALKGRDTLQYRPGTTQNGMAQPAIGQAFSLVNTPDVNGDNVGTLLGGYIITLTAETAAARYTTSGKPPTATFGMLIPVGMVIEVTMQDFTNLQLAATASGCIIDLEISEVDA